MAKGFGFVNRAKAESAASGGGSSLWFGHLIFKLPGDGDVAFGRFIPCGEDEDGDAYVEGAWHHQVPVEGRNWPDQVPCIAQDEDGNRTDDDCPGCERDLPLKFKGFALLIWRDGPVYKKDEKGQVVKDNQGDLVVIGEEDQVAIWSSGPRLFENLAEIDETYGIGSRDFRIKRKGLKTDTEYVIMPRDVDGGKQKLSAADKKLIAGHDIDLADFVKAPSYEEFTARLEGGYSGGSGGGSSNGSGESSPSETAAERNPFARKKD